MLKNLYRLPILFIAVWTSPHAAQTGRVDYAYLGIQFTIPQDWQGQEDADAFLMGSMSQPGLLGVLLNDATSPEDLRREADKGITDETIQLSRSSDFVQVGVEGLGAEFTGYVQSQKAKAFLIGVINPYGKSVTVAALTSHDQYSDKYKRLAFEIVNSLAFAVPKESVITADWRQGLKGNRLAYRYSSYDGGSGYYDSTGSVYGSYSSVSQTTNIDLCSDSTFVYYSSSLSSFDSVGGFGSSGSRNGSNGNWVVSTLGNGEAMLTLKFYDGSQQEFVLSSESGKTYLDNTRYLRVSSSICE